jgi:hypothetical protein
MFCSLKKWKENIESPRPWKLRNLRNTSAKKHENIFVGGHINILYTYVHSFFHVTVFKIICGNKCSFIYLFIIYNITQSVLARNSWKIFQTKIWWVAQLCVLFEYTVFGDSYLFGVCVFSLDSLLFCFSIRAHIKIFPQYYCRDIIWELCEILQIGTNQSHQNHSNCDQWSSYVSSWKITKYSWKLLNFNDNQVTLFIHKWPYRRAGQIFIFVSAGHSGCSLFMHYFRPPGA